MDLITNAYRSITERAGFDINAGQSIDGSKTLKEMIEFVVKHIDDGNKGCCFHASVYLMKLLHDVGIDSEIIITLEPTILDNGEIRNDMRASVLVNKNGKYIVMNPVEDIEFFEKEKIPSSEREKYYVVDSSTLKGEKNNICSSNAGEIDLEDFITRYGDGQAWTIGSLYRDNYDNIPFGSLMKSAKSIDIDDYKTNKPKFN